jgi:hypothetical protein
MKREHIMKSKGRTSQLLGDDISKEMECDKAGNVLLGDDSQVKDIVNAEEIMVNTQENVVSEEGKEEQCYVFSRRMQLRKRIHRK